jgi:hypothetical protein
VLGIVMDAEGGRAIIQIAPANEVRRVRTGDDINGWKIDQIDQRHLVLSLDGRSATFTMFGDADNLLKALVNRREAAPASSLPRSLPARDQQE